MESLKTLIEKAKVDGVSVTISPSAEKTYVFAKSEAEKFLSDAFSCFITENPTERTVKIYLGKSADFGFKVKHVKPEGFDVVISNGSIYLISDTGRGIIYAVYDMLEKLGVKFLTYDYTYFPKELGGETGSYFSDPDFDIRMFLTKNVGLNDFAVKCRMYSENISLPEEKGDTLEWNQSHGNNHTTLYYVPKSVYFTEENKERNKHMYQLNANGDAVDICMTDGITDDGEMDDTMPVSAFKVALNTLIEMAEKDKKSKYFPFGQMDVESCCQCERCKKAEKLYKRSGMNIRFANLLLKHCRKHFEEKGEKREIYLVIFAYNYSTDPPTVIGENGKSVPLVKADDHVCVRIAPIGTNCYFPIESDMHFMPFKRIIDEWHLVAKEIMMWTYHTNYKRYLWYFPTIQHWKQDLKYFKNSGVTYMFMQSDHTESVDWKADMELYVASKALWDSEVDPINVREEYIDAYFSGVAGEVKEILKIFDDNYKGIASRSVEMRKNFWKELFGDLPRVPDNLSISEIMKNLRKEAEVEWTKNVYFSVYHKEIAWAKEQPPSLLERQSELLNKAKEKVKLLSCDDKEKERLTVALKKIELTLRYMILYNYDEYYKDDANGKTAYAEKFFGLCEELGYKDFGEGIKIEKVKENIGYNF